MTIGSSRQATNSQTTTQMDCLNVGSDAGIAILIPRLLVFVCSLCI